MKKFSLIMALICVTYNSVGQQIFYQNTFHGGVLTRIFASWESSTVSVNIPSNSSILKAYLICGNAFDSNYPIDVELNNETLTFDFSTQITNRFDALALQSSGSIHAIDITSIIDPNTQLYSLDVPITAFTFPVGENQNPRFWNYTLYIAYQNDSFPIIESSIYLNNKKIESIVNYSFSTLNPIDTNNDFSLSLLMGSMSTVPTDGSFVYVNSDSIGRVHGWETIPPINGFGLLGQFDYYNDTLWGHGDDTSDSLFFNSDALADISSYLQNGAINFDLTFEYQDPGDPIAESSNPIWATFLTYTSPCDTFSTNINTTDTTICKGESISLQVTGGVNYQWEVFGDSVSNIFNPTFTPDSTTHYLVKITDANGCMNTEMAKVVVANFPIIENINILPSICADSSGMIDVSSVSSGTPFNGGFQYLLDGQYKTDPNLSTFSQLQEGIYNLTIEDMNGCNIDTLIYIDSYINTVANFNVNPETGEIPVDISFINQSSNATNYQWIINNDTSYSVDAVHHFDSSGTYSIQLIAFQYDSTCADTTFQDIIITSPFKVIVPSLFDANWGKLPITTYNCQSISFSVYDLLGKLIYTMSENVIDGTIQTWSAYNFERSLYLYRVEAISIDGEILEQTGKIVLMR